MGRSEHAGGSLEELPATERHSSNLAVSKDRVGVLRWQRARVRVRMSRWWVEGGRVEAGRNALRSRAQLLPSPTSGKVRSLRDCKLQHLLARGVKALLKGAPSTVTPHPPTTMLAQTLRVASVRYLYRYRCAHSWQAQRQSLARAAATPVFRRTFIASANLKGTYSRTW